MIPVAFLQERTALSSLPVEILNAIAPLLELKTIAANEIIITENITPDGLYIIESGRLASNSKTNSVECSLLSGSALNLYALLLKQTTEYTVTTLSETKLWFVDGARFQQLVTQYPEITQVFSQQLASEVKELSQKLSFERERQLILRPYLVSKAKRGVIGKSRYAVRLRSQIKLASENRGAVLIFGEPGLEKDNLAALIHFSSAYRRQPIIKIDCSKLQTSGAELFGRSGGKPGIIEALDEGTLILNNIQQLPTELLPAIASLIKTNKYTPIIRPGNSLSSEKTSKARIILISEQTLPAIDCLITNLIKVPPPSEFAKLI